MLMLMMKKQRAAGRAIHRPYRLGCEHTPSERRGVRPPCAERGGRVRTAKQRSGRCQRRQRQRTMKMMKMMKKTMMIKTIMKGKKRVGRRTRLMTLASNRARMATQTAACARPQLDRRAVSTRGRRANASASAWRWCEHWPIGRHYASQTRCDACDERSDADYDCHSDDDCHGHLDDDDHCGHELTASDWQSQMVMMNRPR